MPFVLVAVLALIGFASPLLAQDEKKVEAADLRLKIDDWIGHQAYGVYMLGKKAGYATTTVTVENFEGKLALRESNNMEVQMKMFGETSIMSSKEDTWYALEGKGQLLRIETVETEDGTTTRKTLQPTDDGWEVITRVGDRIQKREVAAPKIGIALELELDHWVKSEPKKGSKHDMWILDLNEKDINQKESMEYLGSERRIQSGVVEKVYILKMKMDGAVAQVKALNQKVFLEMTVGKIIRMVAEEEQVARRMDTKINDVTIHMSFPIKQDLGKDPSKIDRLSIEATGLGEFKVPKSHRQRLESREGKSDLLHLRRDYRAPKANPLSEAERKRWSKQQPGIESGHKNIRNQARIIIGEETEVLEMTNKLQHWVHENLNFTAARNSNSALTILEQKAGDCTEHARLFVALARSVGLPAREITGVVYTKFEQPLFGWHAWAEVHDGHQWVSVDPTWDQVFVDATHIRLSTGPRDLTWVSMIGSLELRVTEFKKR